jgi:hypothetical protein
MSNISDDDEDKVMNDFLDFSEHDLDKLEQWIKQLTKSFATNQMGEYILILHSGRLNVNFTFNNTYSRENFMEQILQASAKERRGLFKTLNLKIMFDTTDDLNDLDNPATTTLTKHLKMSEEEVMWERETLHAIESDDYWFEVPLEGADPTHGSTVRGETMECRRKIYEGKLDANRCYVAANYQ